MVFSPDGRTLATGGDSLVQLWDVTDPARPAELGKPLTGFIAAVYSLAFSPDSKTLAGGSADATVRLWNVEDREYPVASSRLTGATHDVNSVAFSPDGKTLASGSGDRTVRLWGLEIDQAIQRICTTTRNTLTPEVWQQYVSIPFEPPCPTS
ncbi:WD40 repeat domain-containing protein [Nonomuraea fuscirosea]|uniref:WD40 repeat domain-containing protein n=1 Tax=Nonomuraea fuscirosea TaxID=1291556 RepID=UPI003448076C